ncbi:Protein of unknown function [Escherichia coli]|nr:Protein of unknown function [Escherichia coli]CDU40154.1 Protein of unknown function [Escherichia coli]
MQDGGKLYDD